MYSISNQMYHDLADRLIAAIGKRKFFSGSVAIVAGDVECRLICTLIIERYRGADPTRRVGEIVAIRPVWWECQTTISEETLLNDFSLSELLQTVI